MHRPARPTKTNQRNDIPAPTFRPARGKGNRPRFPRRRNSLGIVATVLLSLATAGRALAEETSRPEGPNVVIILADDMGYGDAGCYGCTDIPTPNIDSLAATGVRCTDGYVTHPFCSPTRAGLLTGRYQQRFGHETNIPFDPQNPHVGLPRSETTIARRLQRAGYATGAVGKWHLGAAHWFHPNRRGFDFFYGFLGGGHDYFLVDMRKPMHEGYFHPLDHNGQPETIEGYLTDILSQQAARFIDENRNRPFFLYLAYNAPHTPLEAPQELLDRFAHIADRKRRAYAAMMTAMDAGIGLVLDRLRAHHLRQNTLVFFLSDNGGPTPHNGSSNRPLRGIKGQMWEGGIRVPFIVSWPAVLPQGVEYRKPVHSLDVSRTALAVAGVAVPNGEKLHGVNLIPYLAGKTADPPHEALFWRTGGGVAWAVRSGPYKLVQPDQQTPPALYDLEADIGETHDLADEMPERAKALRALYDRWNRENLPPRFLGFRPYHQKKAEFYESLLPAPQ